MHAFKKAPRKIWYGDGGLVAGYVTQSTNLTRVVLTNAGHLSPGFVYKFSLMSDFPRDAPGATLEMMINFIEERPFNTSNGK